MDAVTDAHSTQIAQRRPDGGRTGGLPGVRQAMQLRLSGDGQGADELRSADSELGPLSPKQTVPSGRCRSRS